MSHRQVTNILFFNHNVIFLINYKSVNFLCFTYQKWFCLPLGIHNLAIAFQFRRFVNQGWFFLPFEIHNLTIGLTPDLTVNKTAKAFIQNRYNDWFSDQVVWQLKSGNDSTDIKVSSNLSDLKPLHASWIVDLQKHMQGEDELTLKGFKEASI